MTEFDKIHFCFFQHTHTKINWQLALEQNEAQNNSLMFHLAHLTLQATAYHKLSRPITNPLALNAAWWLRINSQLKCNVQVYPSFQLDFSLLWSKFAICILKLLKHPKHLTGQNFFWLNRRRIYWNKALICQVWYHSSENTLCLNISYLNQTPMILNIGIWKNPLPIFHKIYIKHTFIPYAHSLLCSE